MHSLHTDEGNDLSTDVRGDTLRRPNLCRFNPFQENNRRQDEKLYAPLCLP